LIGVLTVVIVAVWRSWPVGQSGRGGTAADDWQVVSSGPGRFRVRMPGYPTTLPGTLVRPGMGANGFGYAFATPEAGFRVSYENYDADSLRDLSPGEILNQAKEDALSEVNTTLLSEKDISFQGHRGKEIIFERPRNERRTCTYRFYLVDRRLYTLGATYRDEASKQKYAARFLDSFELIK
jgi:hypothetical protein